MSAESFVDAIIKAVADHFRYQPPEDTVFATWNNANATDSSLSDITIMNGSGVIGVPKLAQVTGLTPGDVVLCAHFRSSKPLIILGKVVGNISLP